MAGTIWELFLGFFRVGCFAFGGAYGAIPLIRAMVLSHGWMDDEALACMIAVSESTPGPIMVNLATYVGSIQAGVCGAAVATVAVVLPSFVLILLITAVMRTVIQNPWVKAVLEAVKPCMAGIILATGVYMTIKGCVLGGGMGRFPMDVRAMVIVVVLWGVLAAGRKKKRLSPVMVMVLAAGMGVLLYGW
ncbi:MAG: chromate transporter [Hungatella sp.]|jgi:chromate transporter|nr:chromate transporter [Hungatella sp.]